MTIQDLKLRLSGMIDDAEANDCDADPIASGVRCDEMARALLNILKTDLIEAHEIIAEVFE